MVNVTRPGFRRRVFYKEIIKAKIQFNDFPSFLFKNVIKKIPFRIVLF